MCPVVALAALTAVQTVGGVQAAEGQAAAAERQAQIAEQQAGVAREDTALQVDIDKRAQQREIQLAAARKSNAGVEVSSGSPAAVLAQAQRDADFSNKITTREGEKVAIGAQNEASGLRASAQGFRSAGRLNATSSLLGGGLQYYDFKNRGLFNRKRTATQTDAAGRVLGGI